MRYWLCWVLLLGLCSCSAKKHRAPQGDDFASLSGKNLPCWHYVQTKEDLARLQLFQSIYEQQSVHLQQPSDVVRIPHVIHFIWIGPKPFPYESVENIRSWMGKHPDWTFKFWTDRERPLPCPGMQYAHVQGFPFTHLQSCYEQSDSYAEKADLLRYEILYREGGVYVDHDVKCLKAFDLLNSAYDFYCGIDMPNGISLPSCIVPTNNLIGVCQGHPILAECLRSVKEKWEGIGLEYPGTDRDSVFNRVLHRTFWLFGEAVQSRHGLEGRRDVVFPSYYFDAPRDDLALWARHLYAGTWHQTESPFEKMVRQRLMVLSKKSNKMFLALGALSLLNLAGFVSLAIWFRRRSHG